MADVSAVADPNTGVAVYDSYQQSPSWLVFGGTSVASPVVAAVDALAGGRATSTPYGSFAYADPGVFNDVTSGRTGSCGGSYPCTARAGYDGPTGGGLPGGTGTTPPAPVAPVSTAAPAISGTPTQNETLSASTGTWTATPTPTYTYRWSAAQRTAPPSRGPPGRTRSALPTSPRTSPSR